MRTLLIALGMTVSCALLAAAAQSPSSSAPAAPPTLEGGATSVDALLDQFVQALGKSDEQGLHRLRVNEHEYRALIIPGTVKPGAAPRQVSDHTSDYFWSMLNQKSEDVGRDLLLRFRGHTYKRKELTLTKGTRQFAWYTAHGDVRLQVVDENGETKEVRTGTIAEAGGRFKFIGFNTNN